MISIVDNIVSHPLYKAFDKIRHNGNVPQKDIDTLKGIVCKCAEDMEHILKTIPETFKQYTLHDLTHSYNVATKIYEILPKQKIEGENTETVYLNALELAVLWLSILLHDSGMAVTSIEKNEIISSPDYDDFLVPYKKDISSIDKDIFSIYNHESAIFAEYIRRNHAERSKDFVKTKLKSLLEFKGDSLCDIVGRICESHCWGVNVSSSHTDSRKYVGHLSCYRPFNGYLINEQYLACCLRLGDILDFDYTRSPKIVMPYIDFTEEKSIKEWHKHMGVQNQLANEYLVTIFARCKSTQQFVDINTFCEWIDNEIQECSDLLENSSSNVQSNYIFNLSPVVKRKIKMVDETFVPGNFRFQLDYEEILKLLMDKALYPDPALFLRELLQNSLDACRMQEAIARKEGYDLIYKPKIVVYDYSEDKENPRIIFQDNGIGMSEEIVKNYFLRVGKSYYRSDDFIRQQGRLKKDHKITLDACSNFGIGFLSCFLAGDSIEVETYRLPHELLLIKIDGANKYFTIQRIENIDKPHFPFYNGKDFSQETPHKYPGTKITIYLKDKWREFTNEEKEKQDTSIGIAALTLKNFAVNIDYPITIFKATTDKKDEFISTHIPAWGWETGEPPLPDNLPEFWRNYLVPVRIPFEEYEETKDIRGGTWFWFLKDDDGKPTFRKGFLEIGDSFSKPFFEISDKLLSLAIWLKTENSKNVDLKVVIKEIESLSNKKLTNKLLNILSFIDKKDIPELTNKNRKLLASILKGDYQFSSDYTPSNTILTESLLISILSNDLKNILDYSLNNMLERINGFECLNKLSLHGILSPAGICDFNPTTGKTEKVEYFDKLPISSYVDLRFSNAIIPSANRLNITSKDSDNLLVSLNYTALITIEKIIKQNNDTISWLSWIHKITHYDWDGGVSKGLFYAWSKSYCKLFFENLIFTVHLKNNKEIKLSLSELVDKYGLWVPSLNELGKDNYKKKEGIIDCSPISILSSLPYRGNEAQKEINIEKLLKFKFQE